MPRVLSPLAQNLVLLILTLLSFGTATATTHASTESAQDADRDPSHEVIEVTIEEASQPYRWVNDGGPYGGEITDLALDRANPQVLYAFGPGTLFRTTDGAQTWTRVETPRDESGVAFGIDAVHVHNGAVYIIARPSRAFASTDGGQSWAPMACDYQLRHLEVDPETPTTLYAVDREHGILKSADAGATWRVIDPVARVYLDMSADDPQTLWWSLPVQAVLTLSDDGETMTMTRNSFTNPKLTLKEFTCDPDDPKDWRLVVEWQGEWVFEGKNHGVSETTGRTGLTTERMYGGRGGKARLIAITIARPGGETHLTRDGGKTIRTVHPPADGKFIIALRTDPQDPATLYAATSNDTFYFSTDEGETWDLLYSRENDPGREQTQAIALVRKLFYYGVHPEPDQQDDDPFVRRGEQLGERLGSGDRIVAAPSNSTTFYAASERFGVLKSVDDGDTWSEANRGLSTVKTRAVACSPTDADVVYTFDNCHFYRSTDRARSWERIEGPQEWQWHAQSLGTLVPHAGDAETVFACKGSTLWLSQDRGTSWRRLDSEALRFPLKVLFDKDQPDRFCFLTGRRIVTMARNGETTRVAVLPETTDMMNVGLTVLEASADIIYCLDENRVTLWRSEDLGGTWESAKLPIPYVENRLTFVEAHPTNPAHLVCRRHTHSDDFAQNEMFTSADAGRSWQHLRGVPTAHAITFDPRDPNVFYAVSAAVYRTSDGGKTFERLDNGLPGRPIDQIAVSPVDGAVYAAIAGAGVYRLDIGEAGAEGGNE